MNLDNDIISIAKLLYVLILVCSRVNILPLIKVRISMQLSPFLEPDAVTATIVRVINCLAAVMRSIAGWNTMRSCLEVLIIH